MKTVAIMLTHNRRATVEVCLPAWAAAKGDMPLWVFDDRSVEYGDADLRAWGADLVVPAVVEGSGSWHVAQLIRNALQLVLSSDVEWVYICDSDTYPDPAARRIMQQLEQRSSHRVFSLYRSSYQEQARGSWYRTTAQHRGPDGTVILDRARAPGCALLLNADGLRKVGYPFGITEDEHRRNGGSWDHVLSKVLGPVGVLGKSYVEHLGLGGLHNPTWEIDRAVHPTDYLADRRAGLLARIEGLPAPAPELDRQTGYDPAHYWAKRLAVEGPSYVGMGGPTGAARQAGQFLDALLPALHGFVPGSLLGVQRLLDFGCGTGRLGGTLSNDFAYHGIDVNRGALEVFAGKNPELGARLFCGALPPHPPGFFDAVVACTVLQHVPERDIAATCGALRSVLAPGGRVVLIEDANPEGVAPAPHMSFRTAGQYGELLGLPLLHRAPVSAERPGSHYLAVYGHSDT